AMTRPEASAQRIPAGTGPYTLMQMANLLRPAMPSHARRLPKIEAPNWLVRIVGLFDKDVRGNLGGLGVVKRLDSSAATALLGRPLIPARDALVATGGSLLARGLI